MSDRIAILNEGRIVQDGTPRQIHTRSASIFACDDIGETDLLQGTVGVSEGRLAWNPAAASAWAGGLEETEA